MKNTLEKSKNMKIVQSLIEECKHRYNLYFNYMPFFKDDLKRAIIKEISENEAIEEIRKTVEKIRIENQSKISNLQKERYTIITARETTKNKGGNTK